MNKRQKRAKIKAKRQAQKAQKARKGKQGQRDQKSQQAPEDFEENSRLRKKIYKPEIRGEDREDPVITWEKLQATRYHDSNGHNSMAESLGIMLYGRDMTNEDVMNRYRHLNDKDVYRGMSENHEGFEALILRQLMGFPISKILHGKNAINGKLVPNMTRQYEFRLHGDRGSEYQYCCFLYVKGEDNFFKSEGANTLEPIHGGYMQQIPLVYPILSKMTEEELKIIWFDLD